MRRVPQPLLNDFVALQKDVALVSIIGPQEAFRVAQIIQGETFNYTPLIAASGSGKSTLLRCIDLLAEIDDGDVFLDGEVITDPGVDPVAVRRRLGLVFQAYNLFPHLTALQNVVLGEPSPGGRAPCSSTRSPAPSTPNSSARSWKRCGI